jgi:hypothetical protein
VKKIIRAVAITAIGPLLCGAVAFLLLFFAAGLGIFVVPGQYLVTVGVRLGLLDAYRCPPLIPGGMNCAFQTEVLGNIRAFEVGVVACLLVSAVVAGLLAYRNWR